MGCRHGTHIVARMLCQEIAVVVRPDPSRLAVVDHAATESIPFGAMLPALPTSTLTTLLLEGRDAREIPDIEPSLVMMLSQCTASST